MRVRLIAVASVVGVLFHAVVFADSITLYDEFRGGATAGVLKSVTFTAGTVVFGSHNSGIEYDPSLFPSQGTIEVQLRIDQTGAINAAFPGGFSPGSFLIDSAGADARNLGDIALAVSGNGLVTFTLAPVGGVNPSNQIQVMSTSSIVDGFFHTVGVSYGSQGIKLAIDGVVEDADSFTGLRNVTRPVALGDFTDRMFADSSFGFSFIGEVDRIRVSDSLNPILDPTPIPEASTLALLGMGVLGLLGRGVSSSGREKSTEEA